MKDLAFKVQGLCLYKKYFFSKLRLYKENAITYEL